MKPLPNNPPYFHLKAHAICTEGNIRIQWNPINTVTNGLKKFGHVNTGFLRENLWPFCQAAKKVAVITLRGDHNTKDAIRRGFHCQSVQIAQVCWSLLAHIFTDTMCPSIWKQDQKCFSILSMFKCLPITCNIMFMNRCSAQLFGLRSQFWIATCVSNSGLLLLFLA